MKLIALSDLHGTLPYVKDSFDLMLICGDICPVWDHSLNGQEKWLKTEFKEWVRELPYEDSFSRVVCVAGNHDLYLEAMSEKEKSELLDTLGTRFVYLENELYDFEFLENGLKTVSIFGTPYCKQFGKWAFMKDSDTLRHKYSEIPEGIDILISHDSPTLCDLGKIRQRWENVNAGSSILDETIIRVKPKYFFSGHIHSGNHSMTDYNGTLMANVSILDEYYNYTFNILTLNYEYK